MEVLTILVPLELRIRRLIRSALIQRFADAEATAGGMPLALFLGQPADPTLPWIVISMATQDMMHLVDEFPCEPQITVLAGLPSEAEEVTDRERVGPEIAARLRLSGDTGGVREFLHQGLSEIGSHAASRDVSAALIQETRADTFVVAGWRRFPEATSPKILTHQ